MSVNGGTRAATSAKLIFRANANGTRKNTRRNNSGGRMISQRPGFMVILLYWKKSPSALFRTCLRCRRQKARLLPAALCAINWVGDQRAQDSERSSDTGSRASIPNPAAAATDRRVHLRAAHARSVAHHG